MNTPGLIHRQEGFDVGASSRDLRAIRYLAEKRAELDGLRDFRRYNQLTGREAARMEVLTALLPMIAEHSLNADLAKDVQR